MQYRSSFKKSTIIVTGLLIGVAGIMVVQDPPATILIKHRSEYLQGNDTILHKLTNLETLLTELKQDVMDLKNKIKD